MQNKLVPHAPVGVQLSINDGPPYRLAGADFVTACVLGARNGNDANLLLAGIDVPCRDAANHSEVESVALHDGDCLRIDIITADDIKSEHDVVKQLIQSAAQKSDHNGGRLMDEHFSSWRFSIKYDDRLLQVTSDPFDLLQIIIVWRPGDAHVLFRVESVTGLPDGRTQGELWADNQLESGTSIKIRIEGVV